jgi:hypothetical protein
MNSKVPDERREVHVRAKVPDPGAHLAPRLHIKELAVGPASPWEIPFMIMTQPGNPRPQPESREEQKLQELLKKTQSGAELGYLVAGTSEETAQL